MSVKYDPENFPPTESEHVDFSALANNIFSRYDEESSAETYRDDITYIGREVGTSLMANISDFRLTVRLANGMHDAFGLMSQLPDMKYTFMDSVINGAREEGQQELDAQTMDAVNELGATLRQTS